MLSFLFKKETKVEKLIHEYLDNFRLAQESFTDALYACLLGDFENSDFEFQIRQTHKFESKADDIRDKINDLMYRKVLIPESRGDIMRLIEEIDKILALFERILFVIQTQKITVPKFLQLDIKELVRISLECCDLVIRQTTALFKKKEGIRALMTTIDTNESHGDYSERRIITKTFESDLSPFNKLQLKDLVIQIGKISDQADRISKRINIISLKRRV